MPVYVCRMDLTFSLLRKEEEEKKIGLTISINFCELQVTKNIISHFFPLEYWIMMIYDNFVNW